MEGLLYTESMTIRIVEDPDAATIQYAFCEYCRVRLAYGLVDIQHQCGIGWDARPAGMKWINCPNSKCGRRIVLGSWWA